MTLQGKRILIVEDEAMIALAAESAVEDAGGIVVGLATTLEQGLGLVAASEVDAAVLDINLHGKKSYPIAEALVQRSVPFLFTTGYDGDTHPVAAPLLAKPYNDIDLISAVGRLIA